jgi:hypothetical protein
VDFGESLKNQGLLKPPSSPPKANFLKALSDTYLTTETQRTFLKIFSESPWLCGDILEGERYG